MSAPPIASVTRLIDQPRVDRYAVAAHDMNPIHRETPEAYAGPFGQPVAHGMLILALVSEAMGQTWGTTWAEHATLKVRWRQPARVPVLVTASATLRTDADGQATYDIMCASDDGTVLLTGTASVPSV